MSGPFVADEKLAAAVANAIGPVTLYTADGQVLGYVTPADPSPGYLQPPISDEEIERLRTDPNAKWVPAAEVEAKMREVKCTR